MKFYNNVIILLVFLVILFSTASIMIGINLVHLVPQDFTPFFNHKKIEVTVILIGYNRPQSLRRALSSLEKTIIPKDAMNVNFKVCLDGSDEATYRVVSSYDAKWYNGNFTLFQRGEDFGLAKHIVSCWDHPKPNEWALMLEDDLVVSPQIFKAFMDALQARRQTRHGTTAIQGIAMHGQRVNQYCWKGFVRRNHCPEIHDECQTKNATDSILGALMCPDMHFKPPGVDWIGTQIPSSWGAFYTGHSWTTFQQYYAARQQLSDAELTLLELPLSMSNEWEASWKRPFAELMYAMGWTLLYRNVDRQQSLIFTTRDAGVHTEKNSSAYEKESRCLIVLPLEKNFTQSTSGIDVDSIIHLDYCSYPVKNLQVLQKRGLAFVQHMSYYAGNTSPLHTVIRTLQTTHSLGQPSNSYTPAHARLDSLSTAEVILVTTLHEVNRDFREFSEQILRQKMVKFLVVGPAHVCIYLRNYESAHCLPETQFVGSKSHLPIVSKLLQGGLDAAIPNVTKFIGVVNSDIVFQNNSLMQTLTYVHDSEIYNSNCVVVGRRYDVDWTTKEKKLHSVFGLDFFVFNIQGAHYAIKNMPPFVIGRTRWDSYFMGYFVTSPDIQVVDATETLLAIHMMDFANKYSSHTHDDLTNHALATELFRMGRVDYSNYKTTKVGEVEVHRTTQDVTEQFSVHQKRYIFDLFVERSTNYTYSPSGLFPYVTCFCALLENPPKRFCESSELMRYEINRTTDEKVVILPHDSLQAFLPLKNVSFFEHIHVTSSNTLPGSMCCVTINKLPMHSRPRIAEMQLSQDYRGPYDIQCLRGKSFPFTF